MYYFVTGKFKTVDIFSVKEGEFFLIRYAFSIAYIGFFKKQAFTQ